jgi:hypothetical protein
MRTEPRPAGAEPAGRARRPLLASHSIPAVSGQARALTGSSAALLVGLIATALALLLTFPLAGHLSDAVYGPPLDNIGSSAVYWNWLYALQHGRSPFDNQMWGAPFGAGWEHVPFSALQMLISLPLTALVGPTAAFNLEILSGFGLTAIATFGLARRLGLPLVPGAFAALAFTFAPFHVMHSMEHLAESHLEFVSGFLYFAVRWRQEGLRRFAVGAGSVAGLSAWLDPTLTYLLVPAAAAFLIASLVAADQTRWRDLRSRAAEHLPALAVVAGVALLFVPVFALFWSRPGSGNYRGGFSAAAATVHRPISEIVWYSARLPDYVLPWHDNPLTPATVRALEERLPGNFFESSLFIGYTVMALALVGLIWGRGVFVRLLPAILALSGLLMSLEPYPHVLGVQLWAPSGLLYRVLPFFRVYSRFGVLVLLGCALLAGLGLAILQARLGPGRRRWLMAIPFAMLAVEFNNVPPPRVTQMYPAPQEYVWLSTQPAGILAEYPLAPSQLPDAGEPQRRSYEYYQQVHRHPILNSDPTPGPALDVARQLDTYYRPGVSGKLRSLGVGYVFVHRSWYRADGFEVPRAVPGLRYVGSFGDVDVFQPDGST